MEEDDTFVEEDALVPEQLRQGGAEQEAGLLVHLGRAGGRAEVGDLDDGQDDRLRARISRGGEQG